jgi:hypothetical protein
MLDFDFVFFFGGLTGQILVVDNNLSYEKRKNSYALFRTFYELLLDQFYLLYIF